MEWPDTDLNWEYQSHNMRENKLKITIHVVAINVLKVGCLSHSQTAQHVMALTS